MLRRISVHALLFALLALAGAQAASAKYLYSYAVKFVCGYNNTNIGTSNGTDAGEPTVKFGNYATDINIYNFNVDPTVPTDAIIGKDVIVLVDHGKPVGREPKFVKASAADGITLKSGEATMDDCNRIGELLWGAVPIPFPHMIGFLVIQSDEYYTSQVAYETFNPPGSEPWEPNVTALLDPAHLKWGDLVAAGTPLPTPWNQEAFDKVMLGFEKRRRELREKSAPEEAMEALFREVREKTTPMLRAEPYFGKVGAFQGASYEAKGLYRPEVDCIMFSRNPKNFCAVCSRAIERAIRMYTE